MKNYLAVFFLILGFYSGGAWAETICQISNVRFSYDGASSCSRTSSYTMPLACLDAFSTCSKFLNGSSIVSSCPNGVNLDGYTCKIDLTPLCDSLTCPADNGKQCKDSSGATTSLICQTTHFCADGSSLPISQPCVTACPDGTTVPEGDSCPVVICPDGSALPNGSTCPPVQCADGTTVPNGGTCPVVICPDGSGLPNGSTCPDKQCPNGWTVPNGGTCPTETCPDGSIVPKGSSCPTPPPTTPECWDGLSPASSCPPRSNASCIGKYSCNQVGSSLDSGCSSIYLSSGGQCALNSSCEMASFVCDASVSTHKKCLDGSIILKTQFCPEDTKTCPDGSVVSPTVTCSGTTKICSDGSTVWVTATCPTSGGGTGTATATAASYSRGTFTTRAAFDNSEKVTEAKTALKDKFSSIKSEAQVLLVNLSSQNSYQCNPIYVSVIDKNIDFCLDDFTQYFYQLGDILVFSSYLFALFIILG